MNRAVKKIVSLLVATNMFSTYVFASSLVSVSSSDDSLSVSSSQDQLQNVNSNTNRQNNGNTEIHDIDFDAIFGNLEEIDSDYVEMLCAAAKNDIVVIPEGNYSINSGAFKNFTAKHLIIEGKINFIPPRAFEGCKNIETITIKKGPASVMFASFRNCPKLREVILPDYDFALNKSDCSERSVEDLISNSFFRGIIFPGNVSAQRLLTSKIPSQAFKDCPNLKRVVLPTSITSIEKDAFEGCYSLEELVNIENCKLERKEKQRLLDYLWGIRSGTLAFQIEHNPMSKIKPMIDKLKNERPIELKEIYITSPVAGDVSHPIPNGFFKGCEFVEKVVIGAHINGIGDEAFKDCKNLKMVVFEKPEDNRISYIGKSAFEGCESLLNIDFAENAIFILERAFANCTQATSANFSLASEIPESVCENNSKLSKVILSGYVKTIKEKAFMNCSLLNSITNPYIKECQDDLCIDDVSYLDEEVVDRNTLVCQDDLYIDDVSYIGKRAFENSPICVLLVDRSPSFCNFVVPHEAIKNKNVMLCHKYSFDGGTLLSYGDTSNKVIEIPPQINHIKDKALLGLKGVRVNAEDAERIVKMLENQPNIGYLEVYGKNSDRVSLAMLENSNIKKIVIHGCSVDANLADDKFVGLTDLEIINGEIETLENLHSKTLKSLKVTGCGLKSLGNLSANLPGLNSLDVSNNRLENVDVIKNIAFAHVCLKNNSIREVPEALSGLTKDSYEQNGFSLNKIAEGPLRNEIKRQLGANNWNLNKIEKVEITNQNLKSIEGIDLLRGLKSLKLKGCSINDKTPGLSALRNLEFEELDLSYNRLTNVSFIDRLSKLRVLKLNNNSLTSLINLRDASNLEEINIKDNESLKSITSLSGCTNLKRVNISNIGAKEIDALAGCSKLSSIDMRKNSIENVNVLADKVHLRKINMSENNIKSILCLESLISMQRSTGKYKLECVDISNNNIAYVPESLLLKDSKYITQRRDTYSINKNFQDRQFARVVAEILEQRSLSNYQKSCVKEELNKITELDLSGKFIKNIKGINSFKNLQILNLNDNEIDNISDIKLANLKSLSLSNNKITSLESIDNYLGILGLTQLVHLDLSNNKIDNIDALRLLDNLESVNLSYNNIKSIDSLKFKSGLKYLNLKGNKITSLEPLFEENEHGVKTTTKLEDMDASNNMISSLPDDFNCTNLKSFNISNNNLSSINALRKAINAEVVNISNNPKICESKALNALTKLEMLDISHTKISSIDDTTKSKLKELWCIGNEGISAKSGKFNKNIRIRINGYGYAVDNKKSSSTVNDVYLSMEALKVSKNLVGNLREDYEKAIDQLASGQNLDGRNMHGLSGIRAGFTAIDLKDGTGNGRGKCRLIFKKSDKNIIIYEISLNHYKDI